MKRLADSALDIVSMPLFLIVFLVAMIYSGILLIAEKAGVNIE